MRNGYNCIFYIGLASETEYIGVYRQINVGNVCSGNGYNQYTNTNIFRGNLQRTSELATDDNSTNIPNTQWVNAAIAQALAERGL